MTNNSFSQVEFSKFEGKVVLVVNVASQCGYTDGHYRFNFVKMVIMIQCQSSYTDGHLNHFNYFSILTSYKLLLIIFSL